MANARGGDPGSFAVDPKKIAENIALKQENERLKTPVWSSVGVRL